MVTLAGLASTDLSLQVPQFALRFIPIAQPIATDWFLNRHAILT